MREEKQLSLFWTIRAEIARVSNHKTFVIARDLFYKAVREQAIDREEEALLEHFLGVQGAGLINKIKTTTTLPKGYKSWLMLWQKCRAYGDQQQVQIIDYGDMAFTPDFEKVVSYVFDVDHVKGKAMDELMEFLPETADEALRSAYALKRYEAEHTGRHEEPPFAKKLFALHRAMLDAGQY